MSSITINTASKNYTTVLGKSPNEYDLAIVSIDSSGSPGMLNEYVLSQYGYKTEILKILNLSKGYHFLQDEKRNPILFVVTVGAGYTGINLKKNLTEALSVYHKILESKNIWIPLMGTGTGRLALIDSYDTTVGIIKQFHNLFFTISIPKNKIGIDFIEQFNIIIDDLEIENKPGKENKVKTNYYLAGHIWNGKDQMERFITEGIWENGHDNNDVEAVNSAEKGDIIFIKSTFAQNGISYLRLKAIGVIHNNFRNGHIIQVNWHEFDSYIDIENLGKYRRTFARLMPNDIGKVLDMINGAIPEDIKRMNLHSDSTSQSNVDINEFPIDKNTSFVYGQEVGEEIKSYDLIFLPKSSFGGVGNNSIATHILSLLNIDKDSLTFSEENLLKHKYALHNLQVDSKMYSLCFIVTRDELKNYSSFDKQLVEAIENFRKSIEYKKLNGPMNVFIPFLGTGQAGMPMDKSFENLLPGLTQIKNTISPKKIRINYPIQLDNTSVDNYNTLLLKNFKLSPYTKIKSSTAERAENENSEKENDKIPFHLDQVVDEDKLGREPVAKAFVDLIKKDIFTEKLNFSFMVHLQGEWGAGKSSFLNFIAKNLNSGDETWIIVKYNAWQNQHIEPPWWTLIDQIYRQSKSQLNFCATFHLWRKEVSRRIWRYSGWEKIIALVIFLICVFFITYFGQDILNIFKQAAKTDITNPQDTAKSLAEYLSDFIKLVLTICSVFGTLYAFAKFITAPFFMNSSKEAESFVKKASDPMNKVKRHFNDLVDNINSKTKKRQLAIFIDDIDRCDKEFIVNLLEGVQTLFKEKRVLYIVAGDKNWITTSFGSVYEDFKSTAVNQKQLGEFFLEKAFQLSFRMPNISDEAKKNYWNSILGLKKKGGNKQIESRNALSAEKQKEISEVLSISKSDLTSPEFMKKMEMDFNLSEDTVSDIVIEEKNKDTEELRHLLNDFHSFIDTNPRSIIRLANNYTMTRSTLIAERRVVKEEKIFRWLVIEDLYPEVKNLIAKAQTISDISENIGQLIDLNKREKCLSLLSGKKENQKDELTLKEIKNIKGL